MAETFTVEELREAYDYVGSFSLEGLALVRKGGKYFHIHLDGKLAYREKYNSVGPFSEGLARVKKNKKWFHIGPDGKPAYEERYDFVGSFLAGLARTQNGNKCFHIRSNGKTCLRRKI